MAENRFSALIRPDILLAAVAIAIIAILIVPIPGVLLSLLLVLNFTAAFLVLLIVFYLERPLDLSAFPSLLLMMTLFRLSLNVASTKLILSDGDAGVVIDAFGDFVIQNNYVIGTIIFIILVVIQFMVIVKGAGRIGEVAARFTLDAMPGKQMSIDADLNAGLIDDLQAKDRREELNREAEFYGSMDGATKFVKGDAMAGLVITAVNIIGGLIIGVMQQGMEPVEAAKRYTQLTIGDGLVSQIPGLVVSISAGFIVSKTAESGTISDTFVKQLFRRAEPYFLASGMLGLMAVVPGMPFMPFAVLCGGATAVGLRLNKTGYLFAPVATEAQAEGALTGGGDRPALGSGEQPPAGGGEEGEGGLDALPLVTPMTLEIGFGLIPLVDENKDGDLVNRIGRIRDEIKEELGVVIPPISIQDNIELGNNEYRVLVRGLVKARGEVQVGQSLAINPGDATGVIEGVRTHDPAFGFDAVWINTKRTDAAESMGYTVVDSASVVTTHVTKVVQENAADLLSRQDVSNMIERVKEIHTAVVEELIPTQLGIGVVHRVLQQLLAEGVPIHDLACILETLSDYAPHSKDPVILAEFCRQSLAGHIISSHLADNGTLFGMILKPQVEDELRQALTQGPAGGDLALDPQRASVLTDSIVNTFFDLRDEFDADLVILVSPNIRPHIYRLISRRTKELGVLSYAEVSDDVNLKVIATIDPDANQQE
jgi:flagellar biosynthesis protein FlhA